MNPRVLLGRVIRLPLRLLPASTIVRSPRGALRGMRWIVGAAPHGAWLGLLEADKLGRFVARISAGATIWDAGANVGLYTLPAARATGQRGRVVAFEPLPRNVAYLNRHVSLNELSNVTIVEAALCDRAGTLRMAEGDSPSEFHADPEGAREVRALTADGWLAASAEPPPDLIKIDVEGAEARLLLGARMLLERHRPVIFLALHGDGVRQRCMELLRTLEYRIAPLDGVDAFRSSEWLCEPACR